MIAIRFHICEKDDQVRWGRVGKDPSMLGLQVARQASAVVEDIHALKDSRTGMTTLQNINDSVRYAEVELRNDALRCRV